jgi:hypothetical protein
MLDVCDRVLDRCVEGEQAEGLDSPCWLFTGSLSHNGYGQVGIAHHEGVRKAKRRTHRVVYEALVGEIPDGFQLDHLCRNRACCNPWHLQPVPQVVNTERAWAERPLAETCHVGHEWTSANTYVRPDGQRRCRSCIRLTEQSRSRA